MDMAKAGEWAFIAGVVIAILAGVAAGALAGIAMYIPLALLVLGIIVGFLNVSEKETTQFLVAAIALLAAASVAQWSELPMVGGYVVGILNNIAAFVAPAAVLVALKGVWSMAKK